MDRKAAETAVAEAATVAVCVYVVPEELMKGGESGGQCVLCLCGEAGGLGDLCFRITWQGVIW